MPGTTEWSSQEPGDRGLEQQVMDLQCLLDNIPDMLIRVDRDLRILFVNRRLLEGFGLRREDLLGRNLNDAGLEGDQRALWVKTFRESIESGRESTLEFTKGKEPDSLRLFMRVVPELHKEGSAPTFVGRVVDLTGRYREERELRESEEKLSRFIYHAPVGLAMFDREMTCIAASRRWFDNFSQDGKEELGRCHYDLHPDIPQRWKDAHQAGMAGLTVGCASDICRHPDGSEQWVSWDVRPWKDAGGNIGGIVISFEDITAKKKREEKLQQQKDLLQGIFDHAPIMFVLWDSKQHCFTLNRHAEELLGWSSDEANSDDFLCKVFPNTEYRAWVSERMQPGDAGWSEMTLICRDGSRLPGEWSNVALSDDARLAIGVDLRERKRAEEVQRRLSQFPFENPNPVMRFDAGGELLFANVSAWSWLESAGWKGEGPLPDVVLDVVRRGVAADDVLETEIEIAPGQSLWVSVVQPYGEAYVNLYGRDISEWKSAEKKILALTRPIDRAEDISFEDLFDREQIQLVQDQFSASTGVASIITLPDGTPLTRSSNLLDPFEKLLPATENDLPVVWPDAAVGKAGPIICVDRNRFRDAVAQIVMGERHVANWVIGQVRDVSCTSEDLQAYARQVGVDEAEAAAVFDSVPVMSQKKFEDVAAAMFTIANWISDSAYQNLLQARYIEVQRKSKRALRESEERYRVLFESESDAILVFDEESRVFVDVNPAAEALYGYSRHEFLHITHSVIVADGESEHKVFSTPLGTDPTMICSRHYKRDGTVFPVEISMCSVDLRGRRTVIAVVRDITQRQVQERELERNRIELRQLASELTLAGQYERKNVATELHDGICQLISSAHLRLNSIDRDEISSAVAGRLDKVTAILDQALESTRSLTFELSCPLLDELGLAAALQEQCKSLNNTHGIQFKYIGEQCAVPLPLEIKIVVFRAIRELLINVLKHSKACHAQVDLKCKGTRLMVCVRDDGMGFDASKAGRGFSPTGGYGLFSIGESIHHIGGEFSIHSDPEEGTEILFDVPLGGEYV